MYLQNKYTRWYFNIINTAKSRTIEGYKERHHIIPRSFGGSNKKENLVDLTAREHYICHLLLTCMTEGDYKAKMFLAMRMFNKPLYKRNSKLYEQIRTQANQMFKGYKHTPEALAKIRAAATARGSRGISPETRAKIGAANKGKVRTEEFKQNLANIYTGRTRIERKKWV